jgi:hypothetical protein
VSRGAVAEAPLPGGADAGETYVIYGEPLPSPTPTPAPAVGRHSRDPSGWLRFVGQRHSRFVSWLVDSQLRFPGRDGGCGSPRLGCRRLVRQEAVAEVVTDIAAWLWCVTSPSYAIRGFAELPAAAGPSGTSGMGGAIYAVLAGAAAGVLALALVATLPVRRWRVR